MKTELEIEAFATEQCDQYKDYTRINAEYEDIIDFLGKAVITVHEGCYSGSTYVLYQQEDTYGYLEFGWGSCSGCDALAACYNRQSLIELVRELDQSIKWFPTKAEASTYFNEHDWEGSWVSHSAEGRKFIAQSKALLSR